MRLKKGDKVRSRRDCPAGGYKVGDIFTITAVDGDFIEFVDNHGSGRLRPDDEFELLPVAEATGKPAFKVGDRVRVLSDYLPWASVDEIGVVQAVNARDRDCYVKFETERMGDHTWYVRWDNLELAPALTIETGKFYRTRDGRKVGPAVGDGRAERFSLGEKFLYRTDGKYMFNSSESLDGDLIAEWVDEPASNDNQPVAEQQAGTVFIDASKAGPSQLHLAKGRLVKVNQGYGFELARYGDYVWVDTGKKQPVVAHVNEIKEAA